MTTAHRPTFNPAQGGSGRNEGDLSKLSKQYSSRDMPSHTKLKTRQSGQENPADVKGRDFRRELEEREKVSSRDKYGSKESASPIAALLDSTTTAASSVKRQKLESVSVSNLDADDPVDHEEGDDEDDEDDTEELLAELERIKKEREAEKDRQEAERKAEEERIRTESIIHGNPLLNSTKPEFKTKRRWNDDVVFKNCAKGLDDRNKREPSFINDALRSEFHKRFMEKYIK